MSDRSFKRKELLKQFVESYFQALRDKAFSTIIFSEDIVFRSPIAPGGVKLADAGVENTGVKMDATLNRRYVSFKDPDRISWSSI